LMSHLRRPWSEASTNAPFLVPTRTLTPLIRAPFPDAVPPTLIRLRGFIEIIAAHRHFRSTASWQPAHRAFCRISATGWLTEAAVRLACVTAHPEVAASSQIEPQDLEQHRRELTGYCYRMLGSVFDADDAVQETMVRAWRGIDSFEGRSAMRSWLYRIATNVCLDMLRGRQRRARPMDMGPAWTTDSFTGATLPEHAWVQPVPDARVLVGDGDPAELAESRETVRLAFVTALQYLPARPRAGLVP